MLDNIAARKLFACIISASVKIHLVANDMTERGIVYIDESLFFQPNLPAPKND
jgi:hypothetical protein